MIILYPPLYPTYPYDHTIPPPVVRLVTMSRPKSNPNLKRQPPDKARPATTAVVHSKEKEVVVVDKEVVLDIPKRSLSPPPSNLSLPLPPSQLDVSVKGSLTLLKTRGSRRKTRTAADLDPPPSLNDVDPPPYPTSSYSGDTIEGEGGGPPPVGDMLTCNSCSRHFNPMSFHKHVQVCEKVFIRKRQAFDSSKMRIQAIPELIDHIRGKGGGTSSNITIPTPPTPASSTWKEQSESFRQSMKAARLVRQAVAAGRPLPPPLTTLPDPSLVPCPHCGRRYSSKAADRHIPQCANIIAKPSSLKRGAGIGGGVGGSSSSGKGPPPPNGKKSWQ